MASIPNALRITVDATEEIRTTGSGGGGGAVNVTQVAGNTVAATPAAALPVELFDGTNPLGTTSNALNERIRKSGSILFGPAAIPGNTSPYFDSGWNDTTLDGTVFLEISQSNNTGAISMGSALVVFATDDTSNTNTQNTIFANNTLNPGEFQVVLAIRQRYWKIQMSNNTANTPTVELAVTACNQPPQIGIQVVGAFPTSPVPTALMSGSGIADAQTCYMPIGMNNASAIVTGWLGVGLGVSVGTNVMNMLRTPNTFKTAQATASGNTAVWTPTAGKKFRLMRYRVMVTENATLGAGAVLTISFQDAAVAVNIAHDLFVPTTAGTVFAGWYDSGWTDLGNGILSSTINNVLNVNLSAALTAGNVRVTCCGTEE